MLGSCQQLFVTDCHSPCVSAHLPIADNLPAVHECNVAFVIWQHMQSYDAGCYHVLEDWVNTIANLLDVHVPKATHDMPARPCKACHICRDPLVDMHF